jgi:cytoskeletal protein CcmA (bactofilin family)
MGFIKMKNIFSSKLKNDSFTDLISNGMNLDGNITFRGTLKIEGMVNGDHILSNMFTANPETTDVDYACLYVAAGACLNSREVKSYDVIVGGNCNSKILHAENTMRILKSAHISNAIIYYRTLEIEPGAMLKNCQMKHLDYCSEGEMT